MGHSNTWKKYFIVDNTVPVPQGLRFGRGFSGFIDNGQPQFTYNPNNVKLYDTLESSMEDFNKIDIGVMVLYIEIIQHGNEVPPNINTQLIAKK